LVDGDDEDVIVYNQDDLKPTEEEEEEYKREFHQIMQESLDSRKNERKVQQFDIPIPMGIKKDLRDNKSDSYSQDDDSEEEKNNVEFVLLTKKGNKQQAKSLSVPNDCLFAVSARNQREIERKEQIKLKKLVLNYEEQEEKSRRKNRMENRRYYRELRK